MKLNCSLYSLKLVYKHIMSETKIVQQAKSTATYPNVSENGETDEQKQCVSVVPLKVF